jgi:hypothetical protein
MASAGGHPALPSLRQTLRHAGRENLQPRVLGKARGADQTTESKSTMTDAGPMHITVRRGQDGTQY